MSKITAPAANKAFDARVTFSYSGTLLCDAATAAELIKLLPRLKLVENEWTGDESVLVEADRNVTIEMGGWTPFTRDQYRSLRDAKQAEKDANAKLVGQPAE
jgi:hypothetical protein